MVARFSDVKDRLLQVQSRRLVAELCRRASKTRAWFYKALAGEVSLLDALPHVNAVLEPSTHPITAAREALGLSQVELARRLGVSRMTIYDWEHTEATQDRVDRVNAAKTDRSSA
jgi:hypothetical protein